ncbi:hypothetical protein [Pedobacter kyonggii]|nr:hypothetical protein [Pedobacter kyonggii]
MEKFEKVKQLISDIEADAGKLYNSKNGADCLYYGILYFSASSLKT